MVVWPRLSDHWLTVAGVTAAAAATSAFLVYRWRRRDYVYIGEVSGLHNFPIKSCGGLTGRNAICTAAGLQMSGVVDRHFVIVTSNGDFITQRQHPKMAGIKTAVDNHQLVLDAPGMPTLRVEVSPELDRGKLVQCRVWDSKVEAQDCSQEAGQWLSDYLGVADLKLLVLTSGLPLRKTECGKTHPNHQVGFPDKGPYLVATEESLIDLNNRMGQSQDGEITMKNFRPNITIKGCGKAWDEDTWLYLKIGEHIHMRVLEPCGRCLLTTVHPEKLERRQDGEPLKTLKDFRIFPTVHTTAPLFATYTALDSAPGPIRVGDPVYVVKGQRGFS